MNYNITADLSNKNLSKKDLRNMNLRGANLRGANLSKSNLSGMNLINADLTGANLQGADLSHSILRKAKLINTLISGADLRYADLEDAYISGTRIKDAIHLKKGKIEKKNYDETGLTTCNDFIMIDEMNIKDIVNDKEHIIFVGADNSSFCMELNDFKHILDDPSNWITSCRNPGELYLRMIISGGGGTGLINMADIKRYIKSKKKIFHLEFEKTIPKTQGYLILKRKESLVSGYHCQDGSNLDVYKIYKCSGKKCL